MKRLLLVLTLAIIAAPLAGATFQKEVNASPGETLDVNVRGGSIQVSGWEKNLVAVNATVGGGDAGAAGLEVRRTDTGVEIVQRGGRHQTRRLDIRVSVPRKFNLDIATMGGSITVDNVEGSLGGTTMGGELRLTRVGGTLAMSTHGGNVLLRDSSADGSVRTMGGQVLFENVTGDVKGTSMGGNVVYRNVTRRDGSATGNSVNITTMGGEIEVADAPDGAELSTMGGDVQVGRARGFVKAKTMGGSIELGAVDGWIEATTMGGDVTAAMVGNPAQGDRHVMVDSKGGDIDLTLPAGLAMDVDVQIVFTKDSSRDFEITSDFPLQITTTPEWSYGKGNAHRIIRGSGRNGSGKNKVTIRTINGDVRIQKR